MDTDAMRIFTKILKPVFGYLRKQGHLSVVFVDDSYLQADTEQECIKNINATVNILTMLGFTIHERKSVLIPTQKIEFLGFLIDSRNMSISISEEKANHLILKIRDFLSISVPYPTVIINNRISYITIPCYAIRKVTLQGLGKGEKFLIEKGRWQF